MLSPRLHQDYSPLLQEIEDCLQSESRPVPKQGIKDGLVGSMALFATPTAVDDFTLVDCTGALPPWRPMMIGNHLPNICHCVDSLAMDPFERDASRASLSQRSRPLSHRQ